MQNLCVIQAIKISSSAFLIARFHFCLFSVANQSWVLVLNLHAHVREVLSLSRSFFAPPQARTTAAAANGNDTSVLNWHGIALFLDERRTGGQRVAGVQVLTTTRRQQSQQQVVLDGHDGPLIPQHTPLSIHMHLCLRPKYLHTAYAWFGDVDNMCWHCYDPNFQHTSNASSSSSRHCCPCATEMDVALARNRHKIGRREVATSHETRHRSCLSGVRWSWHISVS